MLLSIELVPRDVAGLVQEASAVVKAFPQFEWLNIPDIRRLPVRSHDAAAAAAARLPLRVIPHIRTRDRSVEESLAILARLAEVGVQDALLVTGDPLDQEETPPVTSLDLLEAARSERLDIQLWAAFDPYRGELRAELEYVQAKVAAGAAGLFTQPFFDLRLAEICLDQLVGIQTFVGISPVTTEASRKYWERTNRVVFPPPFQPTLEHCARLGADLLRLCEERSQHAYLMPIRVDALTYLEATFAHVDQDARRAFGAMS